MVRHRVDLPAVAESCRTAREIIRRLDEAVPRPVLDDLAMVADELVTQAVLAAPPSEATIMFEVQTDRYEITVAVEDAADASPLDSLIDGGHQTGGLAIVDGAADRWGLEKRGSRTRTWATFVIPSPTDVDLIPTASA